MCVAKAKELGYESIRLVQEAYNTTSFSLYAKLGFEPKDQLTFLHGIFMFASFLNIDIKKNEESRKNITTLNALTFFSHYNLVGVPDQSFPLPEWEGGPNFTIRKLKAGDVPLCAALHRRITVP